MNFIKSLYTIFQKKDIDKKTESEKEIKREKIERCISISKNENAFLSFLKDKNYFFYTQNSEEKCFIMYGQKGNSYIAMGDPIGEKIFFKNCIEEFKKFCKKNKKKCIFYEIDHENIGDYIKNEMIISKIGERGKIYLKDFTLEGSEMRKMRYVYTHLKKEGYIFKIVKKQDLDNILEELESISKE